MNIYETIKVKNLHDGNRPAPAGYASWIDYWMKKKGVSSKPKCANIACGRTAEHGGHVKKVNSSDNHWYIVPLCVDCNENKDLEFRCKVSDLVPVNV